MRKHAAKKKARKQQKKELKERQEAEDAAARKAALAEVRNKKKKNPYKKGKNKNHEEDDEPVINDKETANLSLLFDDNQANEEDYDMRALVLPSDRKGKKQKNKKDKDTSSAAVAVDLSDERFRPVLAGNDPRFGIDRTAAEFRDTEGMRAILTEQQRRRQEREYGTEQQNHSSSDTKTNMHSKLAVNNGDNSNKDDYLSLNTADDTANGNNGGNLDSLVNKLKRKFHENAAPTPAITTTATTPNHSKTLSQSKKVMSSGKKIKK